MQIDKKTLRNILWQAFGDDHSIVECDVYARSNILRGVELKEFKDVMSVMIGNELVHEGVNDGYHVITDKGRRLIDDPEDVSINITKRAK